MSLEENEPVFLTKEELVGKIKKEIHNIQKLGIVSRHMNSLRIYYFLHNF